MKRILFLSMITALFSFAAVSAQPRIPMPRDSQKATVAQTVGVTDISITYSRPPVKGRTIFANAPESMESRAKGEATLDNQNERKAGEPIVPYGHVWRAGANEATLFVVNDDVLINGKPLAAGRYSLHTVPGKDEWTVIFNKDDGQWGSFSYDATKDALRVKAKPEWTTDSQEFLTYMIEPSAFNSKTDTSGSAIVNIRWEKVRVPFTVEVKDITNKAMAKIRTSVAAAKPDDWQTRMQAANYAKANKQPDDANKWYDEALKINDAEIAKGETMQNLARKATILLGLGRGPEALASAEKAVTVGKASGAKAADIEALEKRIADMKKQ